MKEKIKYILLGAYVVIISVCFGAIYVLLDLGNTSDAQVTETMLNPDIEPMEDCTITIEYFESTTPPSEESETLEETETESSEEYSWEGSVLNSYDGVNAGPSGKETYYNLPMHGVVKIMRDMGNEDEYWVREDGVKMLGEYVMVAADLELRPRGSLVPTSLGMGIVCDTGDFIYQNKNQLDIAVDW